MPAENGLIPELLDVLDSLEATTTAIDHYLEGRPNSLTIGQIVKIRTAVQKRLLWLPRRKDLPTTSSSAPTLYECCRLTAVIFSIAVTYPIPNTYNILQGLVREVQVEIERLEIQSCGEDSLKFLLWVLTLAGIAALGKPERSWFVMHMRLVRMRTSILDTWNSLEDVLRSFLWLESACSPGGRVLWDEVASLVERVD